MSIFDVLTNGQLGSVIDSITKQAGGAAGGFNVSDIGNALNQLGGKAKTAARDIRDNTPGGIGGLAGAGALGALFGNLLGGDLMKSVALAGAGAVAWNFYKKWAAQQLGQKAGQPDQPGQAAPSFPRAQREAAGDAPDGWGQLSSKPAAAQVPSSAPAIGVDPTAELVMRAMIYAARADGNIDKEEQERIDAILHNMLPGQDVSGAVKRIREEMIDPNKIAIATGSPEQADDVYRLSCAIIDIDHFMEHSYLQTLAQALGLSDAKKRQLEQEADQARRQLAATAQA